MLSFFKSVKYKKMYHQHQKEMLSDILMEESLTCKTLHSISEFNDKDIKIKVLFHKNCTLGIISKLLLDDDIDVRLNAEDRLEALKKPTYYTK